MWYYRPTKVSRKDGSVYWCVKEYYPKEELIEDLEYMLKCCKNEDMLEDKE